MAENFWSRFLRVLDEKDSRPDCLSQETPPERLVLLGNNDDDNCLGFKVSGELLRHHESLMMKMKKMKVDTGAKRQEGKSHLESSACNWNLELLNTYIKRDQVELVENICRSDLPGQIYFPNFQENLISCSQQMLDENEEFTDDSEEGLKLKRLQNCQLPEKTISILVQNILGPMCQKLEIKMKPEIKHKQDKQFGCAVVDYALVYKGICFGVVELKTPQSMKPDSVAQLLLPLMKLQVQYRNSSMKYLGILTDGYRYVFVLLKGDKFSFEYVGSVDDPIVNIRKPYKWVDLHNLLQRTYSILDGILDLLKTMAQRNTTVDGSDRPLALVKDDDKDFWEYFGL